MTTAQDLHHAARQLADTYAALAELKWTPERPTSERVMRTQGGSRSPSPDNDHAFSIEYELWRNDDNGAPGGLRMVAADALAYTTAPRHTPNQAGYLDEHLAPGILCAHIARHATEIAEHFPAVDELTELLRDQHRYLTRRIHHHRGQNLKALPVDTVATGFGTAADLAPLVSAAVGKHFTRDQIRYWGRSGRVTPYTTAEGTTHYRLGDLIEAAREYSDKRAHH
ncbi:Uncharacterised protein [Corynebacterium imitans]|uniref:Uncharacterized protein n=1 Tax=Corynebacterium imitans TaxID=156978 RepID=A0A076NJ35_9CORY|nr:hypothetical protein [Corynebacterium imitans]AIJ33453.1 hypothetical protein CIMIT_05665 [Corynebacterium imitans]SNV70619.1 Uncharacterised protein [Corynebacterium imitans]